MDICIVCLRTDRTVKVPDTSLQEFHAELCRNSVVTMVCCYCTECEYLLTKFYKFKEKCIQAQRIYEEWLSVKADEGHHKSLLHTLLPPSPLGVCSLNSDRMGEFTVQATETQADVCFEVETIKTTKPVKVEYEQCNDDLSLADVLKNENTSEDIKLERFDYDSDREDSVTIKDVDDLLNTKNESTDSDLPIKRERTKKKLARTKKTVKKLTKKSEKVAKKVLKSKKIASSQISSKMRACLARCNENNKKYESVFEIEYLSTLEKKLEEFQNRKTYNHYVVAEHKCEICYQVVKSSKFLEYHMNKWHNQSKDSILCPICNTWNSKSSKHMGTHVVVFKCKLCPLVTHRRETMKNHFEQHKGKQYHCEQCNTTYNSNSAYLNHMGKAHREGKNICESCGRGFRSPIGLTIHKNNSFRCTKDVNNSSGDTTEAVRCEECDVTFPSQEVYNAHVIDVHEPKRKSRPKTSSGLPETKQQSHAQRRKRIRRTPEHTCRLCGKVGLSFYWLQLHFKKEHPNDDIDVLYADKKKHLCDICGSGFSSMFGLRDHRNIHTGLRPHACDICPKRFHSANKMKDHRVRHFPPAIPCTYCGKQFKSKANLYTHVMTHTGEKNHKCDICGKRFALHCNLKEHVRGVHYNIRRVKKGAGGGEGGAKTKRRKIMPEADVDSDFESE